MGRGNGSVKFTGFYWRCPEALLMLAKLYQNERGLASINAAITELLETHPKIAEIAERVYNQGNQAKQAERLSP